MTNYPSVRLTPREDDVCRLMLKGFSAREIGSILGIARRTVEQHINSVRNKLLAENRVHIAAHLLVRGIITMTTSDL
ncbi:helix-turn-helix transcriptional regulator [Sphingomonas sp. 2SG]|uniref:helix-turn-helix domain-containing protein n=1 Tax=Sphingomonas sp. 2SG TaxID=2502201 RepID=UPI001485962D|nr:helix-turn-helix transcriptional regulator [Sphingomonas sp. 2SG]